MKNIVTPLLLLLTGYCATIHAQPSWNWGIRGNDNGPKVSNHNDNVTDMATDPNGNLYILSKVFTGGDVNGIPVHGYDNVLHTNETIVLSSYTCSGKYRWHKTIGGTASFNKSVAVKTDTLGGVYLAGNVLAYAAHPDPLTFPDSLHIDKDSVSGSTNKTLFVVKYDTAGTYEWLRMPQPDTVSALTSLMHTRSVDMDVAPNGDVFVYSILSPGLYEGGAFKIDKKHFYIMQYDRNGVFKKTLPLDVSYTEYSDPDNLTGFINGTNARFKRDHKNGQFYLCGTFQGNDGSYSIGSTMLAYTGGYTQSLYIGSFDNSGKALWVKQATPAGAGTFGSSSGTISRVAVDEASNVYLTGYALAGDSWYGYKFTNPYDAITRPTMLLMKLDAKGTVQWISTPSRDKSSNGTALHMAYANGIVGIAGIHGITDWGKFHLEQWELPVPGEGLDIFLGRFNAATGQVLSLDTLNSDPGGQEYIYAMTADRNGNFFIGGLYDIGLYVAKNKLENYYEEDWFVAKFGSAVCNCTIPTPEFAATTTSGNTINFTYKGTTPYTSISWDFGDGSPESSALSPAHPYAISGTYTVCVHVTNNCGSKIYCKTVTTSGTGINEVPGFEGLHIFPNPATREITIKNATEGTTLSLHDITGRQLLQTSLAGNAKDIVDISTVVPGVYILRFADNKGHHGISRLVKQ